MSLQMAELLYESAPELDSEAIFQRVEALIESGVAPADSKSSPDSMVLFHTKHRVQYKDAAAPAQTMILPSDSAPQLERYTETIQQSWLCDDAQQRVERSNTCRLVTEMMARGLEPQDRLTLFHGVLQAVVELTNPLAIVFSHSQQIVTPEDYLNGCDEPPILRPGSLNVRFFRISNSEQEDMIMDTRGLDDIGLHDLQCHFRNLDPDEVGNILYSTGLYIAEHGAVIEAGHTVAGTTPDAKWTCQFEESLLDPKRDILDLNPGPPFAAGTRES